MNWNFSWKENLKQLSSATLESSVKIDIWRPSRWAQAGLNTTNFLNKNALERTRSSKVLDISMHKQNGTWCRRDFKLKMRCWTSQFDLIHFKFFFCGKIQFPAFWQSDGTAQGLKIHFRNRYPFQQSHDYILAKIRKWKFPLRYITNWPDTTFADDSTFQTSKREWTTEQFMRVRDARKKRKTPVIHFAFSLVESTSTYSAQKS